MLVVCAASAACKRESAPPPAPAGTPPPAAAASAPVDPVLAEEAALAALPIHLDQPLGADLHLAGLSVAAKPGGRSWEVTLYSRVLHKQADRPQLWVHAYPPANPEYKIVQPTGNFPSADVGRIVKDGFLLPNPGAYNLYTGVTRAGADPYGPAVSIGWVVVGSPASPAFQSGIQFLKSADNSRVAAMQAQALHDYPETAGNSSAR